jgi:hypothetical protein
MKKMNEAENFKLKISTGRDEFDNRVPSSFKILTLKDVYKIIDNSQTDDNTKLELKKKADKYPFQALKTFIKNLDKNIAKIRSDK